VFSVSKSSFDLLKPQFAYSFWCFPQAKAALTYSNPSLLSNFGILRNIRKKDAINRRIYKGLIIVETAIHRVSYHWV
jgi:hypothetical protein